MLGPTKEMFDIMPTMGNKTEANQILNGQDPAFFFYGCTAPNTVSSLPEKERKEKKKRFLKKCYPNSKSDYFPIKI